MKMLTSKYSKCIWTAGLIVIAYTICQETTSQVLHAKGYFTPTEQQKNKMDAILNQQRKLNNDLNSMKNVTIHDGVFEDSWLEEQKRRAAAVRRECKGWKRNPQYSPTHLKNLTYLLVDDHHKAIYCYIAKVACTNWKRLWMILTGLTSVEDPMLIPENVPHRIHDRMMLIKQPITISTLRKKLLTYTKLIVVRNPYERLISAFRNKFEGTGKDHYKKNYAYHIMKTYRKNLSYSEIPLSGDGLTFPEFVAYIINLPSGYFDEHWKSYADSCYPCAIQYDVIAKYETMAEDSKRFLKLINAPSDLHFPKYTPSNTSKIIDAYMATLSTDQRKILYSVYEKDFKMFEYSELKN
ncbi:carbohydrate sulfotransferase 11-like [Palaemon carinicauda]|uniref:carbohydrate sulfotransferase 11-like n=1 Tax=Palaemon carinicauda TaxID=392227 RepID=UPI0035B601DD